MQGIVKGLIIAGVAVLMIGCAGKPQYRADKPGATREDFTKDDAKCQVQSSGVQIADWEYQGTFMEGANIQMKRQNIYNLCMTSEGYTMSRM